MFKTKIHQKINFLCKFLSKIKTVKGKYQNMFVYITLLIKKLPPIPTIKFTLDALCLFRGHRQ